MKSLISKSSLLPVFDHLQYVIESWSGGIPWMRLAMKVVVHALSLSSFFCLVSVAYVSRSGGMSNELNNIISRTTNGVYEGVAIGGDRYAALYYDRKY